MFKVSHTFCQTWLRPAVLNLSSGPRLIFGAHVSLPLSSPLSSWVLDSQQHMCIHLIHPFNFKCTLKWRWIDLCWSNIYAIGTYRLVPKKVFQKCFFDKRGQFLNASWKATTFETWGWETKLIHDQDWESRSIQVSHSLAGNCWKWDLNQVGGRVGFL